MTNKIFFLLAMLLTSISATKAQNNVGIGTNTPNASAVLDIVSTDKGLLIPRVTLTNTFNPLPVSAPANGLLVYNLNPAVTNGNGVGYYSWTGTNLLKLSTQNSELEKITEATNTGYRLLGKNPNNYGNIGNGAIDLSHSASTSATKGATGANSVAMGTETTARSFGEMVVGMNNANYTPTSTNTWFKGDRAFVVGVGASDTNKRDGLIVYKDGSIGLHDFDDINTPYYWPNTLYSKNGILYYNQTPLLESPVRYSGWMGLRKSLNINNSSYAPVGDYATDLSSSTGGNSDLGASGNFSFCAGVNTKAQNYYSTALGENTVASTRSEMSVGAYNDTSSYSSALYTWHGNDKIFQIGTGQSDGTRSSSLVVYKNGRVLIAPANGTATIAPFGSTSYVGWQNISNWNINDPAALEVAPMENSNNSSLKVFGRSANTNITVLKDSNIAGKKFMSFKAGLGVFEIGSVTIGTSGVSTNFNTTSDKRLKIDNGTYSRGLSTINDIKIHDYTWKTGGKDVGVFAQELYEAYPNAVLKGDDKQVDDITQIEERWQVDYSKLVPVLVAATQELSKKNETLAAENEALKKQMAGFNSRLASIENFMHAQPSNNSNTTAANVSTK